MLEEKEEELTTAAQKLQETLSAAAAANKTIKQLDEAVQHFDYKCQTKGSNNTTVQQRRFLIHKGGNQV